MSQSAKVTRIANDELRIKRRKSMVHDNYLPLNYNGDESLLIKIPSATRFTVLPKFTLVGFGFREREERRVSVYICIYIYLYVQIYIGRMHRHRVASPCLVVNKANELASERASGRSQQAATRAYLSAIDFSLVIDVEPLSTGGVLFLPHGTERMLRSVANGYLLPPARALRDAVLLNTSDKEAWGIYGGRGRRVGQRVSPRIDARHRDTGSALGSNRRDNGILSLSLSLPPPFSFASSRSLPLLFFLSFFPVAFPTS